MGVKLANQRIAAVVPAAGASRRMGRDKRRIVLRDGQTVLEITVAALSDAGLAPLVVVLERDSPCRALPGLQGATLVENPDPSRGMLSSIREGLAALPDDVIGAAIQPGDHPFAPVEAVRRLAERFAARRPALLRPRYVDADAARSDGASGRAGHPLFISRELFAEASACDDAIGLRQLVRRRHDDIEELVIAAPDAEQDLDTPDDLARAQRRQG